MSNQFHIVVHLRIFLLMKHLFIFSIILYSFTSQSVNSQNVDYDNWSSACDDAITTVDLNQCFYRQRHIADSLMLDTYNKISVILDKGLEEAALESDKEMIQWYGSNVVWKKMNPKKQLKRRRLCDAYSWASYLPQNLQNSFIGDYMRTYNMIDKSSHMKQY